MFDMNLKGKVVVVAGATGGIGSAIVTELDKARAICVLIGTNEEKLKALVSKLKRKQWKYYVSDFTQSSSVEKVAKEVLHDFDKIDVLVNAAGYGIYKPIEEVTHEDWDKSFAIGVTGPYFLTKYLLAKISKSDLALVLNMGSGAGVIPMAGRSVYNVQKYALRGMTLSLAEEFKRARTHFCLITLGSTLTAFGPMTLQEKEEEQLSGKAYFTPEWVGKKLVEIIGDKNREVEYKLYPSDYVGGFWKPPEPEKK